MARTRANHHIQQTSKRGVSHPKRAQSQHYAFHVSDVEFEVIFSRVKAQGLPYDSGPHSHADGQINSRRGGRGFYFKDPNGHLLEIMTVPETRS